jgi:uncharacterized membrane protein
VNIVLWILQGLLAAAFLMAGIMHATQPKAKLVARLPWAEDFSPPTLRFIGTAEMLGALGLILPAATGILPWLTPLAATGLAVIMVLAAATHARRKEPQAIALNLGLAAIAIVIAWGRFGPYSF